MSITVTGRKPELQETSSNAYGLNRAEAEQFKQFNALTEDEKAERLWREDQERSIRDYVSKQEKHEASNSNLVQHLSGGGAAIGGALRPDALVNYQGVEMTVQQAVDIGVYKPVAIGHQTSDINEIEELI